MCVADVRWVWESEGQGGGCSGTLVGVTGMLLWSRSAGCDQRAVPMGYTWIRVLDDILEPWVHRVDRNWA